MYSRSSHLSVMVIFVFASVVISSELAAEADEPSGADSVELAELIVFRWSYFTWGLNIDPAGPMAVAYAAPAASSMRTKLISDEHPFVLVTDFNDAGLAVAYTSKYADEDDFKSWGYGMVNREGKAVVPLKYELINVGDDGFVTVKHRESIEKPFEWGLLNPAGEWVVPLGKYTYLGWYSDGLCAFNTDEDSHKWGFVNGKGEVAIKPRHKFIGVPAFFGGFARLTHGGETQRFLDRDGETAIEIEASYASIFKEGLARVELHEPWDGPQPPPPEDWPEDEGPFVGNKTKVRSGFINPKGEFAIEPEWGMAGDFHEDLARVSRIHRGRVRSGGEHVDWELHSTEMRAPHEEEDELWGFIDRNGELVIEPKFEYVEPFHEGLAAFREGHRWGYIDKKGEVQIEPRFLEAKRFQQGYALVLLEKDFALINTKGDMVLRIGPHGRRFDETREPAPPVEYNPF